MKQTVPVRVVFIEHVGPYWTVGPVFAQVREYMRTHDRKGPMFMRYLRSPQVRAADSLTTQVGFIVKPGKPGPAEPGLPGAGDHHPEPPFKTVQRDRELVAYMIVADPPKGGLTPWRDYKMIHEWIRSRGLQAAGPVTEIYDLVSSEAAAGPRRIEVQVSLQPQQEKKLVARPTLPPLTEVPHPSPQAKGGRLILSEDVSTDPISPPLRLRRNGAHAEPIEPVSALIAANRFDRIAEQLMPDDSPLPGTLQVWFGQMVFRIGAAAKGIQQMYPGQEQVVTAMADALTRRYRTVSASFTVDPLEQVVVYVNVHRNPRARKKRAIMHDLDTLLGRIALRSVGPEATLKELVGILQRMQDFLRAQRSQPNGVVRP